MHALRRKIHETECLLNNMREEFAANDAPERIKNLQITTLERRLEDLQMQLKEMESQLEGSRLDLSGATDSLSRDVFFGPSVEGEDMEYVKVLCGKVNSKKPSFAR